MESTVPVGAAAQEEEGLRQAGAYVEEVLTRVNLVRALGLFILALGAIFSFQHHYSLPIGGQSSAPHFVYQAQAFLHGRLSISLTPSVTDVVVIGGKYYIIYPPFPAIALMPFVAIFGTATSDILFTSVVSVLGLPLLYLTLEQAQVYAAKPRVWWGNALISLLFFFGSINLWLSLGGRVWFTAQIVCTTCEFAALLLALRRHYVWASVLLMCAFFSRATAVFGFLFIAYLAFEDTGRDPHLLTVLRSGVSVIRRRATVQMAWREVPWRRLIGVVAVVALTFGLYILHNIAEFGSPLESGYNIITQQRYPQITNGAFSLHYVKANIIANFFNFPRVMFSGPFDRHPVIDMLNHGISVGVFFTTPLFLYLFWKNRQYNPARIVLWGVIALVVAETLLFNASGWYQFGARYLFDGYPYVFLLLALNEFDIDWRFVSLGLVSVVINLLGAIQFWTNQMPHL